MFILQMGKLSPSSVKERAQGCTDRRRLNWGPKNFSMGLEHYPLSTTHSVLHCCSGDGGAGGWWVRVPYANILLPSPRDYCLAWPDAWHL